MSIPVPPLIASIDLDHSLLALMFSQVALGGDLVSANRLSFYIMSDQSPLLQHFGILQVGNLVVVGSMR